MTDDEPTRPRYSATAKLTRIEILVIEEALNRMMTATDLSIVETALITDTIDHLGKVAKQFDK